MTWSVSLNIPYHQQDTDDHCGGATAQMILESIGGGLIDQKTLCESNHSNNTQKGWSTDPNGLCYTLNKLKPASHSDFTVYSEATETLGSHRIAYTLWHNNSAIGTMVYGKFCHWIVVKGVELDVDPSTLTSPDNPYSIDGFWINNPWPPCPSWDNSSAVPPPPHSSTNGCGGGDKRGAANEYVTYTDWQKTYFTGCKWVVNAPQFICVCNPEVPKLGKLVVKRTKGKVEGEGIITPNEATRLALRGLKRHNLIQDKTFSKACESAQPETPILVQRLDREDSFYYIIPILQGNQTTITLTIDGLSGDFLGGRVHNEGQRKLMISRDDVLDRIMNKPVELPGRRGLTKIRDGAFSLYPVMVWKPCLESRSPYYPFYMIIVGTSTFYVSYNGILHPELREPVRRG